MDSYDAALEQFRALCGHFLSSGERARTHPRPGAFVENWAMHASGERPGAALLLSQLVYFHRQSETRDHHRLRPCYIEGLTDEDLNRSTIGEYLRRPFFVDYANMFAFLGLSERQVIDAVRELRFRGLIERHKVSGHRGPVIVLHEEFHHTLQFHGRLECDYRPDRTRGEWRTWIHASEVIALPRLSQALVLARWLRWMEWRKRNRRPENTHGQLGEQLGMSERAVQRAMRRLYDLGLLVEDYVRRSVGRGRKLKIPSPRHGDEERERLARLTVEALARRVELPECIDLTEFWRLPGKSSPAEAAGRRTPRRKAGKKGAQQAAEAETISPRRHPRRPMVKRRRRRPPPCSYARHAPLGELLERL